MLRDEWLTEDRRYWLDNFKRLRDDKKNLIDENEHLKQRIKNLVSENTKLQNDLFSEQLIQDEQDEYIEKLKLELDKWIDNELEARELVNKHLKQKCIVEKENKKLKLELFELYRNKD